MLRIILVATLCLATPLFAANDKEQANSYDNAWEAKWVAHCREVYRVAGKSPGFTLQIGDTITRPNPNTQWPRQGAGKTSEDVDICTWMSASQWSADNPPDIQIKNGWYLAAANLTNRRSFTTLSSIRPSDMVLGSQRGGPAMPKVSFPPEARSLIADGIGYPNSLQIDTIAAAFDDAQFAVLLLGSADTSRKRGPEDVAGDLENIVNALEQQHIVVIISTLPPDTNGDNLKMVVQYNDAIRTMAQKHGLPLIDFYQEIMARQPGEAWKGTLIENNIYPTAHAGDLNSGSDPYGPDGDKATHRTGANAALLGYLLRSWLTVQKMKEVKARIVDLDRKQLDTELAALQAKLDKAEGPARDAIAEAICDLYLQSNRMQEALAFSDKMITAAGQDHRRIGEWLFRKVHLLETSADADTAVMAAYRQIIETCSPDTSLGAQARVYLGELYLKRKNTPDAIKEFQAALSDPNRDIAIETWLLGRLSRVLMQTGRTEEALKLYNASIDQELLPGTKATRLLKLAELCLQVKMAGEAVKTYRRVLLEHTDNEEACFEALQALFDIHLSSPDKKIAVADALRFYMAANSSTRMSQAIGLIAQALRALDSKSDRAIAFLKWQKDGPSPGGAAPAETDPFTAILADCPAGPSEEELQLLDPALKKLTNSPEDRRRRAYLNLFFGRPKEAMVDLKINFQTCPVDEVSVQFAANDVAAGLKALDGHAFRIPVLFEFMAYGVAGKSGQEHLVDPLKDF